MCYKGKCLYCIPIKPVCLVLAIINAVANGLIVMWAAFMVYEHSDGPFLKIGGVRFKRDVSEDDRDLWMSLVAVVLIWYCYVAPVVAFFNVIFSGLLCDGICNSRPKQVNAYFWYGIAVTVLMVIASAALIYVETNSPHANYSETSEWMGLVWLLACILHALFLVLVHQTHKKVVEDTISKGPAHLIEDRKFSDKKHLIKV